MQIPFFNRIAYRQARNSVIIALLLGLGISIVQISIDLLEEKERLNATISQVMGTLEDLAVQAVYRIDTRQGEEVISGLFSYRPVIKAELINDYGVTLAQRERPAVSSRMNWIANLIIPDNTFSTTLHIMENERQGQLNVTVDRFLIIEDFINRSTLIIISGFFRNVILAFFLMLMFYFSLTRPILKTVKGLISVDLDNPAGRQLPQDIGHDKDEFGLLTRTINSLLSKFEESITNHQAAENRIKASLKEKEVLLREVHHRVKNNMQVINSLLSLQSDQIQDSQYADMFDDSRNRILSMAMIHEKLYQSDNMAYIDFDEYIETLSSSLLTFYKSINENILLDLDIEKVPLGIETAIPLGLLINEILSNSLKHAFPDKRDGRVSISLSKEHRDGNIQYTLIIKDNGIGLPEDLDISNSSTLGLQLVTTLAQNQLRGMIEINRTAGTEIKIVFHDIKYTPRM